MNILLINVPSRMNKAGFMLPIGLLYVGAICEREECSVTLWDMYTEKNSDEYHISEKMLSLIDEIRPSIIAYGGIATSYPRMKILSQVVKNNFPEITQIAGGALASVYELILEKTSVDVVFHGEAENSLPLFINSVRQGEPFENIPGIAYLAEGKVISNAPTIQIENIDTIPYPAYHLLDMGLYYESGRNRVQVYIDHHYSPNIHEITEKIPPDDRMICLINSRGCSHHCNFCYRHMKGVRYHSVDYIISHMKFLNTNYGVRGFNFVSELFNQSEQWVYEFCDALEREPLGFFFSISGTRVSNITESQLKKLKRAGCIEISYGQESGSDTILREIGKGVTAEDNKMITVLTKKIGIPSTVQVVIGSPSENCMTISETIQFIISTNSYPISGNYMIPLPGTRIWRQVTDNNMITDLEKYLEIVSELEGHFPIINMTQVPDKTWRLWLIKIRYYSRLHYFFNNRMYYAYLRSYFFLLFHITKNYLISGKTGLV